jgi:hypothetical protein
MFSDETWVTEPVNVSARTGSGEATIAAETSAKADAMGTIERTGSPHFHSI